MTLCRPARQALIGTSSKLFIDSRRDNLTPTDRCPLAYTRLTIMPPGTSQTDSIESMRRCRLATTAMTCLAHRPGMPVGLVERIPWGRWGLLVAWKHLLVEEALCHRYVLMLLSQTLDHGGAGANINDRDRPGLISSIHYRAWILFQAWVLHHSPDRSFERKRWALIPTKSLYLPPSS